MTRHRTKILEGQVIENYYPNKGLVLLEDKKYIMKDALMGQMVRFKRGKRHSGYYDAKVIEHLNASDLETEEGCLVHKRCGGCRYQTLSFRAENSLKHEMLKKLYQDIYPAQIPFFESPLKKGYRAKMEYSFGDTVKNGPLVLGLHSKNKFYEITDTLSCNIVDEVFETIRQEVQAYFREKEASFYSKKTHTGLLRHLIIRKSFSNQEYMVNLVTTSEPLDEKMFLDRLLALHLPITSVLHTINDQLSDAVICDEIRLLYGKDYITERLLGLDFQISPFSFFQPNPKMAEVIYQHALDLAGDIRDQKVYDLYSGTGTIGQIFALQAKEVIGIEIIPEAVDAANRNRALNHLDNCQFICNDVFEELDRITDSDIIVLDPPRTGIHPKAIHSIIAKKPKKFIYISCNPVTHRRDLEIFLENGYTLNNLQLFDQFPRTVHCEAIAELVR